MEFRGGHDDDGERYERSGNQLQELHDLLEVFLRAETHPATAYLDSGDGQLSFRAVPEEWRGPEPPLENPLIPSIVDRDDKSMLVESFSNRMYGLFDDFMEVLPPDIAVEIGLATDETLPKVDKAVTRQEGFFNGGSEETSELVGTAGMIDFFGGRFDGMSVGIMSLRDQFAKKTLFVIAKDSRALLPVIIAEPNNDTVVQECGRIFGHGTGLADLINGRFEDEREIEEVLKEVKNIAFGVPEDVVDTMFERVRQIAHSVLQHGLTVEPAGPDEVETHINILKALTAK